MDSLLLASGNDIPVTSMSLELRQPFLKDIGKFGEARFSKVLSLLRYTKADYEEQLLKNTSPEDAEAVKTGLMFMTDFQIILETAKEEATLKADLIGLFYLLIPNARKVIIEENRFLSISFMDDSPSLFMTDQMFEEFREALLEMFLMKDKDKQGFNPVNDKAAQIAKKLEERHKKLAIERGEQDKETSSIATGASILSTLNNISLKEIYEYTLPQLFFQLERSKKLIHYDTQITLGAFSGLKDVEIADWGESI